MRWIKNFLTGRIQRVVINGCKSSFLPVSSGIPQGSVLGPTLFLIYVNDLPEGILSSIKLCADDTKLYCVIKLEMDREVLQQDINRLVKWTEVWQLPLNASKCKTLTVGRGNEGYDYLMQVADSSSVIAKVAEEKDLGLICDSDLNFTSHIKDCIRKANQQVRLIRRSFMYLDEKSFMMLYKTLVRPILEYCSSVWYPMFKRDSKALEGVQRRATKVLRNLRDLSYPERFFRLKLPSLVYRRRRSDLIQVKECYIILMILTTQNSLNWLKVAKQEDTL